MPSADELRRSLPQHTRLREMLAACDDPHPRRTRRIEWVGEQNPLDNDRYVATLLLGGYTALQAEAIRRASAFSRTRVDHLRARVMEQDTDRRALSRVAHLSQTYAWRPSNNFICEMTYADVETLFADDTVRHEFRDLDDPAATEQVIVPSPEVFRLIATEVLHRDVDVVPYRFVAASH
jgi:hypothetical protein